MNTTSRFQSAFVADDAAPFPWSDDNLDSFDFLPHPCIEDDDPCVAELDAAITLH